MPKRKPQPRPFAVTLGIPAWRQIEAQTMLCVRSFERYAAQQRAHVDLYVLEGDADIARSRGRLATQFLDEDRGDVLLMIDSDIGFRADQVYRMCRHAERLGVVGGLYVVRNGPQPALRLTPEFPVTIPDDVRAPVEALAGGCLAMSRAALEAVRDLIGAKRYPDGWMPLFAQEDMALPDGRFVYGSEDWAFCQRARRAGFPPYLDCAVELEHVGSHRYRPSDILAQRWAPQTGRVRLTLGFDDRLRSQRIDAPTEGR